jgi:hypothetical protein
MLRGLPKEMIHCRVKTEHRTPHGLEKSWLTRLLHARPDALGLSPASRISVFFLFSFFVFLFFDFLFVSFCFF